MKQNELKKVSKCLKFAELNLIKKKNIIKHGPVLKS